MQTAAITICPGSHLILTQVRGSLTGRSRLTTTEVERNAATGRKYKRAIRILKRLRDRMYDDGIAIAKKTPSFLIECLVWNAEVDAFSKDTYTAIVRCLLADLWNRTRKDDDCSEWGEVNELKYLFRLAQPWTRQEANEFLQAAWDYIGYQ